MQFMPPEWSDLRRGRDRQRRRRPVQPGRCDLRRRALPEGRRRPARHQDAIFAYNHSAAYVESVLLRAELLGGLPERMVDALSNLANGHFPIQPHDHPTYAPNGSGGSVGQPASRLDGGRRGARQRPAPPPCRRPRRCRVRPPRPTRRAAPRSTPTPTPRSSRCRTAWSARSATAAGSAATCSCATRTATPTRMATWPRSSRCTRSRSRRRPSRCPRPATPRRCPAPPAPNAPATAGDHPPVRPPPGHRADRRERGHGRERGHRAAAPASPSHRRPSRCPRDWSRASTCALSRDPLAALLASTTKAPDRRPVARKAASPRGRPPGHGVAR